MREVKLSAIWSSTVSQHTEHNTPCYRHLLQGRDASFAARSRAACAQMAVNWRVYHQAHACLMVHQGSCCAGNASGWQAGL
jgi:hypothetical protein